MKSMDFLGMSFPACIRSERTSESYCQRGIKTVFRIRNDGKRRAFRLQNAERLFASIIREENNIDKIGNPEKPRDLHEEIPPANVFVENRLRAHHLRPKSVCSDVIACRRILNFQLVQSLVPADDVVLRKTRNERAGERPNRERGTLFGVTEIRLAGTRDHRRKDNAQNFSLGPGTLVRSCPCD